jgi:hypothetical protein
MALRACIMLQACSQPKKVQTIKRYGRWNQHGRDMTIESILNANIQWMPSKISPRFKWLLTDGNGDACFLLPLFLVSNKTEYGQI